MQQKSYYIEQLFFQNKFILLKFLLYKNLNLALNSPTFLMLIMNKMVKFLKLTLITVIIILFRLEIYNNNTLLPRKLCQSYNIIIFRIE